MLFAWVWEDAIFCWVSSRVAISLTFLIEFRFEFIKNLQAEFFILNFANSSSSSVNFPEFMLSSSKFWVSLKLNQRFFEIEFVSGRKNEFEFAALGCSQWRWKYVQVGGLKFVLPHQRVGGFAPNTPHTCHRSIHHAIRRLSCTLFR